MLTEERFAEILRMLGEEKSVTVQELTERLATSESTIRRDLTALAEKGLLVKVHGGATALEMDYRTKDVEITSRMTQNVDEKSLIGKYAASLIEKEEFCLSGFGKQYCTDAKIHDRQWGGICDEWDCPCTEPDKERDYCLSGWRDV